MQNIFEKTALWCSGPNLLIKCIIMPHRQVENEIPPTQASSLEESVEPNGGVHFG